MCVTRLALICVRNLTVCIYIRIYIYTYIYAYIHTDESFLTQTSLVTRLVRDKFHVTRLIFLSLCQFYVPSVFVNFVFHVMRLNSLSLCQFFVSSLCQICAPCDATYFPLSLPNFCSLSLSVSKFSLSLSILCFM